MLGKNIFLEIYHDPEIIKKLTDHEWDILIRQSRKSQVLATLCYILERKALLQFVPAKPLNHLVSSKIIADKHLNDISWEMNRIQNALSALSIPVVFLKGAAYIAAGSTNSEGRLFHDVDILVPKNKLQDVEKNLINHGWYSTYLNDYDQKYYRQWMHELPPMKHMRRNTLLDVHHHIVPLTSQAIPDVDKLFSDITEYSPKSLQTLSPTDMILHSIVHMFHDGEFDHSLRDLVDIDMLIQFYNDKGDLPDRIIQRSIELNLERPVFYAFRYLKRILRVDYLNYAADKVKIGQPNVVLLRCMDFLFIRAITAHHASCDKLFSSFSRWCLYVRAHYLRMPIQLLIPHLIRKVIMKDENLI